MLDEQIKVQLRDLGRKIKDIIPDMDGNIQFNLSRNFPEPKVNINLADVTKRKG